MTDFRAEKAISIVEATEQDIPLLRDLTEQTFREAYSDSTDPASMEQHVQRNFRLEQIAADFQLPATRFVLARCADQWAGFLLLRTDHTHELLAPARALYLHRIYVRRDFWRQQVGSALMQYAIDAARQDQYDWLWLVVWDQNQRAIDFYRRWGFEHFGYEMFQFGDEWTRDWAMRRAGHL